MPHWKKKTISVLGSLALAAIFLFFTSFSTIRSITDSAHFGSTIGIEPLSTNTTSSNLSSSFLFSKDNIDFKPTTRIPEQKCNHILSQPPKTIASFQSYEHIKSLTELTTIHGNSDSTLAICNFDEGKPGGTHFPHVMQHLYMCYTFWQDNSSRVPVLYLSGRYGKEKMIQIFSHNPFLKGFVELLTSQLKVQILSYEEIIDWFKANEMNTDVVLSSKENSTSITFTDASASDYGNGKKENDSDRDDSDNDINFRFHEMQSPIGYVLSHVDKLNQMAQQHFDFGEGNDATTPCSIPRIGILNRRALNGRSITNPEEIIGNITSELFNRSDTTLSSSSPVSLTYFEGLTFEQQVHFFHNVDLLISPHGAQLTGIPFLASKPCSRLIELFPHNYLLPDYFGTLARDSGVEYSYIYVSESPADVIEQAQIQSELKGRIVPQTAYERSAARKQNLCISPTKIVDTLRDAIGDWCKCTSDKN